MTLRELLIWLVRRNKSALIERLRRNTERDGECLIWIRAKNNDNYPKMNFRVLGKHVQVYVHRLMYVLHTGHDIPDDLELDHTCNRRDCVAPKHLEAVTHAVNMERMFNRRYTPEEVQQMFDEMEECL
ncbi:MAG: HNH endonuclease [Nitrospira sp.]